MKLKKKTVESEIFTGSMADVSFLLIIYFLVATVLVKVKSIPVNLPTGQKQPEAQVEKTPVINGPFGGKP